VAGAEQVYFAAVRMRLDLTQMPKTFQVSALANRDWNLSSDWARWTFVQARARRRCGRPGARSGGDSRRKMKSLIVAPRRLAASCCFCSLRPAPTRRSLPATTRGCSG
jgi:hypothetical protein